MSVYRNLFSAELKSARIIMKFLELRKLQQK